MIRTWPLLCLLLPAVGIAQAPLRPHLVLARTADTNPATRLCQVDAASGQLRLLDRFPGDTEAPLAIATDPVDGQVVLALDAGGATHVLRLDPATGSSSDLGLVAGTVRDLAVDSEHLWLVDDSANGGLWRMPRRGGAAELRFAHPNLTAVAPAQASGQVLVAWSGRPFSGAAEAGLAAIDGASGAVAWGPIALPAAPSGEIVGVADLPTGVPCQLAAFADGSLFAISGSGAVVSPVALAAAPNGGLTALHGADPSTLSALALSGGATPLLYGVDVFSGTARVLSPTLPGTPVDFARGLPLVGSVTTFGAPCGADQLHAAVLGRLQPGGSIRFEVSHAAPNSIDVLVLGRDDDAGMLPLPVFGSCLLQVLPDAAFVHAADPFGWAQHVLTVPLDVRFLGLRVFSQWVEPGADGSVSVSAGTAVQVGF